MKFITALFALMLAANANAQTSITDPRTTVEPADLGNQILCDCQDWMQWHLNRVRARETWPVNTGTQSFKVAVSASGIDTLGYDFGLYLYGGQPGSNPNIWTNPNDWYDGIDNDNNGYIDDVHGVNVDQSQIGLDSDVQDWWWPGTAISSLMAAEGPEDCFRGVGVAQNLTIVPIKSFSGPAGNAFSEVLALRYARALGCKIYLGFSGTNYVYQPVKDEIALNTAAGMLTIWCSAGGVGGDGSIDQCAEPCELSGAAYPSKYTDPGMLVVANAYYTGSNSASPLSGWGPISVDLFAPVRDNTQPSSRAGLVTTIQGNAWVKTADFFAFGGASQVAACAAMIWGAHPNLTAAQVKAYIMDNVRTYPGLNNKCVSDGMLDVKAAVDAANAGGPIEIESLPGAVAAPVARPADGKTYDVQGRRVDDGYQGVKFVNGRKRVEVKP